MSNASQLAWLITGCSSGFGDILTRALLARGDLVIATSRGDKQRLQELETAGAFTLELDVTWPQSRIDDTMRVALERYDRIDVLVNNAGYIESGLLEDVSHERFLAQCNTNLFGAINVTRSLLPHMKQRRAGTIAFIGSLGGLCPVPTASPYSITKAGLDVVADCLQAETAAHGIRSVVFELGYYQGTQVHSAQNWKDSTPGDADGQNILDGIRESYAAENLTSPGDPRKAVDTLIWVLKSDKPIPSRLPLGNHALTAIRAQCREILQICDEWENIILEAD